MSNNNSPHILNTSSNLLGFCLVVLTSLKITAYSELSIIDECTGLASIVLITCSFLSFLSLRTKNQNLSARYERIADVFFLIALTMIFLTTFLISFSFMK